MQKIQPDGFQPTEEVLYNVLVNCSATRGFIALERAGSHFGVEARDRTAERLISEGYKVVVDAGLDEMLVINKPAERGDYPV